MDYKEDNRSIQEIMTDLERVCLDFQKKWEVFKADYKSKCSNRDNERRLS